MTLSETHETLPASSKRKRDQDVDEQTPERAADAYKAKAAKRKKRKKTKKSDGDLNDEERADGLNHSIGKMDGRLLADYFAQKAKRHNKDITEVELNDIYLPDSAFLDTSSWDSARDTEHLAAFIEKFGSEKGYPLSQAPEAKGSPHTLVITLAGLRAADITRALRSFQTKDCAVSKLFAKHIKLAEAQEYVKNTRMGVGIGTPARLNDLVDSGALSIKFLRRVVIDGSYVDQKKRGIFDMKDLHMPLLKFLNHASLRDRYNSKKDRVYIMVY